MGRTEQKGVICQIKVLQQGRVRVQQSGKEFSPYLNGGLFDLVCDQVSGVMRQLGQNPSEAEIQDMVNQVRVDNGHGGCEEDI